MKLKALWSGRLELWRWSRRRGEWRQAALLIVLVSSLVMLRNSELYDLRTQHEGVQTELAALKRQMPFSALPTVTFILEAKTAEELDLKMAIIGNSTDIERLKLRRKK